MVLSMEVIEHLKTGPTSRPCQRSSDRSAGALGALGCTTTCARDASLHGPVELLRQLQSRARARRRTHRDDAQRQLGNVAAQRADLRRLAVCVGPAPARARSGENAAALRAVGLPPGEPRDAPRVEPAARRPARARPRRAHAPARARRAPWRRLVRRCRQGARAKDDAGERETRCDDRARADVRRALGRAAVRAAAGGAPAAVFPRHRERCRHAAAAAALPSAARGRRRRSTGRLRAAVLQRRHHGVAWTAAGADCDAVDVWIPARRRGRQHALALGAALGLRVGSPARCGARRSAHDGAAWRAAVARVVAAARVESTVAELAAIRRACARYFVARPSRATNCAARAAAPGRHEPTPTS